MYDDLDFVTVIKCGSYKGYDYAILSMGTHPTAYVRIPEGHKYFDKHYDDVDIEVHGGLTYSAGSVKHINKRGSWVGWDYNHYDDYSTSDITDSGHKWTEIEVMEHVKSAINQLKGV